MKNLNTHCTPGQLELSVHNQPCKVGWPWALPVAPGSQQLSSGLSQPASCWSQAWQQVQKEQARCWLSPNKEAPL